MKLANFFYLLGDEQVFLIFRAVYRSTVSDAAVMDLVQLCLTSIPDDIIISEWFLFEELRPIKRNNKQLPTKTFYLMSSDEKKQYFIRHTGNRRRALSHIGFAAISHPHNMRLLVKL